MVFETWHTRFLSQAGVVIAFGPLQIEGYTFPVNQNDAAIDEFLPAAVEFVVAHEGRKRDHEFHGFRIRLHLLMNCGAEINSFKLRAIVKIFEDRPQQVGNMLIKRQRGNTIL